VHFDLDNPNPQMVESTEACLEFVNECKPELIFMDVNISGMNV